MLQDTVNPANAAASAAANRALSASMAATRRYEIRFQSLFNSGRTMAFPCDRNGQVDMDKLSANAVSNYLFARTLVGRDFASPTVNLSDC